MPRKLLSNKELDWTAVVANNRMNRSRKAIGVNSYEQDLGFSPVQFLLERAGKEEVRWLDLCCGEGNALIQAPEILRQENIHFQLTGLDLAGHFSAIPVDVSHHVELIEQNLKDWQVKGKFELITIVHGLHYLGDKLGILAKYLPHLTPDGLLVGHLDLENLEIRGAEDSDTHLRNYFLEERIIYDSQQYLLSVDGPRQLTLPYSYQGADIGAGPNYTGQAAVTSVYQVCK